MSRIVRNLDFEDDMENDFIATLLGEMSEKITKPTLDQILDKINSKGYECLSNFEKDTLENYSKK
jgi:hypothetical protein